VNPEIDSLDTPKGEWIALVSGLDVGSKKLDNYKHDIRLQLLTEYLTAELGGTSDRSEASKISRLIIAGDSLAPVDPIRDDMDNLVPPRVHRGKPRKLVTTQPHPLHMFCEYLQDIASSMPVHLMPGARDPSGITLPQQPFPRAMFGDVKKFKNFHCETNPAWFGMDGCS
jgi:DNA polymerase delta subunit 2